MKFILLFVAALTVQAQTFNGVPNQTLGGPLLTAGATIAANTLVVQSGTTYITAPVGAAGCAPGIVATSAATTGNSFNVANIQGTTAQIYADSAIASGARYVGCPATTGGYVVDLGPATQANLATIPSTTYIVGQTTGPVSSGALASVSLQGGWGGNILSFTQFPRNANFVTDGDSLTSDTGTGLSAGQAWPIQLIAMSNMAGSGVSRTNFATNGNTCTQVQSRYTASVHPLSPAVTGKFGLLSMWCGANDYDNSETATTIENLLSTYWSGAKADGWKLMAWTIIRRGDQADIDGVNEAVRLAVNAWIRGQFRTGAYDYLIDADRILQNPFDPTLFYTDFIHPSAAGAYLEARYVNGVLWGDDNTQNITNSDVYIGSGNGNVRLSNFSLSSLTTGNNNTAAGWNSGKAITTASGNTLLGERSGPALTTGGQNTLLGYEAGRLFSTQTNNTGVGWGVLYTNASGTDNVAVGANAAVNGTSGSYNVYLGSSAGYGDTANDNVAIGYNAMVGITLGSQNVAIGSGAMYGSAGTTPAGNVVIGKGSGGAITGNSNVCIGYAVCASGDTMSGGSNIAIGNGARVSGAGAGSAQIGIGTNATANTFQFENWNFLDSGGNSYFNLNKTAIGPALASSSTITPVSGIAHVTGTSAILTISIPGVCGTSGISCHLTLIPDGLWTTGTGGNIAIASTAVVSRVMTMDYDPATSKWYPSY